MASGECRKKLIAFSRDFSVDNTPIVPVVTKECQGVVTEEFCCLSFQGRLELGPCEPLPPVPPVLPAGNLHATVEVLRLQPGGAHELRGCFSGQWQLVEDGGRVLAAGELSGTVGVGTHRPPLMNCEQCDAPDHYEGKFTGQVLVPGELFGAEICATLAGRGPLQPNQAQQMAIEGVVIQCCPE